MKVLVAWAVVGCAVACGSAAHEGGTAAPPQRTPPLMQAAPGDRATSTPSGPSAPGARGAPASSVSAATVQITRGKELYVRMCAVCHGASGEGYKADQAPAIGRTEYLVSVPDAFLRTAIVDGRKGSTMSAWGAVHGGPLSPEDVDALVAVMRGWQVGPAVRLDESPLRGDVANGARLYAAECARCHGADGKAALAVRIGNPDWLASASNGLLRHAISAGRPGTQMEAFGPKLGAQGVEDVIAYVRDIAAPHPVQPPRSTPPQAAPLPLGKVPLNPAGPEPKGFRVHPETTPADVIHKELMRGAKMALLDARAPTDYAAEHIAGAVSVPFYDPSPYLEKLPKHAWLVSYCACPHAESRDLAAKLLAAGFTKVTVLNEGLGYWKRKGYKTKTGPTQGKP